MALNETQFKVLVDTLLAREAQMTDKLADLDEARDARMAAWDLARDKCLEDIENFRDKRMSEIEAERQI